MSDVDYKKWASYIEEIFKINNLTPSLMLDLGCGTGSFCIEMASRGYDMIGVDLSPEMLSCASAKSIEKSLDILFLRQDMTQFELYGTVDAIVCLLDSVNYVTRKQDIKRLFKLVANYLNPGGLFVFDVNSRYKFEHILNGNVFYSVGDDITYIWENEYDVKKKVCRFDLTFFIKEGNCYKRHDEVHFERAYDIEELCRIIDTSGLKLVSIYNDLSFIPPGEKCERIFFVCGKQDYE